MSATCQEFVQNAWKKDLCSNCFKAKLDHVGSDSRVRGLNGSENGVEPPPTLDSREPKATLLEKNGVQVSLPLGIVGGGIREIGSSTNGNNSNNNRCIRNNASPRKIGSSGVHLWEVGHILEKEDSLSPPTAFNGLGSNADMESDESQIQSILKDQLKKNTPISSVGVNSERRGSVGFTEGSPQVIGYGGHDYEWDDQESSDDPSDVDSLENFDLSEEDRAFSQLTDKNTEFNSDNSNLINESLGLNLNDDVADSGLDNATQHHSAPSFASRLTSQYFHSYIAHKPSGLKMASSSDDREKTDSPVLQSYRSTGAPSFIRSNLFGTTGSFNEDNGNVVEDYDNDEDGDDGTFVVKIPTAKENGAARHQNGCSVKVDKGAVDDSVPTTKIFQRIGSETVPSCKHPTAPRTTVQNLFSDEPVTSSESKSVGNYTGQQPLAASRRDSSSNPNLPAAAASKESSLPIKKSIDPGDTCSPYGVVSISGMPTPPVPPAISSCPPPSPSTSLKTSTNGGNVSKLNVKIGGDRSMERTGRVISVMDPSPPRSTVGICSTFQSPADSDSRSAMVRNRDYSVANNYSCHYASSYISGGAQSQTAATSLDRSVKSSTSALPPTPLTNPYSSTAILKGLPSSPPSPPTQCPPEPHSPQKPPLLKPKPKLPVKPAVTVKSPDGGGVATVPNVAAEECSPPISKGGCEINSSAKGGDLDSIQKSLSEVIAAKLARTSACYQEIDEDVNAQSRAAASKVSERTAVLPSTPPPPPPINYERRDAAEENSSTQVTFNKKMSTSTSALPDYGKRTPKRQAPRPPTASGPSDPRSSTLSNRSSVTSATQSSSPSSEPNSPSRDLPIKLLTFGSNHSESHASSSSAATTPTSDHSMSFNDSRSSSNCTATPGTASNTSSNSFTAAYECLTTRETPKASKPKKSKFSLKKLLKFGSKDDHDGSSPKFKGRFSFGHGSDSLSGGQERRAKLEILHPIDLIHSVPSKQDTGSISSSCVEVPVEAAGFDSTKDVYNSRQHQENGSAQGPALSKMQGWSGDSTAEVNHSQVESSLRYKPPPPPRSNRSHSEEQVTAAKDKPLRPPPPTKLVSHPLTKEPVSDERAVDVVPAETSMAVLRRKDAAVRGSSQTTEHRDIRNSMAPRKPERCTSSGTMDIAFENDGHVNGDDNPLARNDELSLNGDDKSLGREVTYYAPTRNSECPDDLYADQAALESLPPLGSLGSSSIHSNYHDSLNECNERIRSIEKVDFVNAQQSPLKGKESNECKVYERVVLKKGNLEKTYSKTPVAMATLEAGGGSSHSSPSITLSLSDMDEGELGAVAGWPRRKSSRLSLRKPKTMVHKNLEDNYGAVVSANHQTLTQILEQVLLNQHITTSKVKLLEGIPLHWSDFTLLEDSQVTVWGQKNFYSAICQQNVEVTLMLGQDPLFPFAQSSRNPCVLVPTCEFEDVIPASYFGGAKGGDQVCRGTVWVMERMRVETISSVAEALHLQAETDSETFEREVCFILLQLINGLKHLQMLGIEEVDGDMADFLLIMKNNDISYRLVILPKSSSASDGGRAAAPDARETKLSLCQGALAAALRLLNLKAPPPEGGVWPTAVPSGEAFQLIMDILSQERATSLSQAKLLLEYLLWGPTNLHSNVRHCSVEDTTSGEAVADQEQPYQRWLDLERATVLNNLIRTQSLWQIRLTVFEEYMLSFLVRTSAKTLREAANQLCINQSRNG